MPQLMATAAGSTPALGGRQTKRPPLRSRSQPTSSPHQTHTFLRSPAVSQGGVRQQRHESLSGNGTKEQRNARIYGSALTLSRPRLTKYASTVCQASEHTSGQICLQGRRGVRGRQGCAYQRLAAQDFFQGCRAEGAEAQEVFSHHCRQLRCCKLDGLAAGQVTHSRGCRSASLRGTILGLKAMAKCSASAGLKEPWQWHSHSG